MTNLLFRMFRLSPAGGPQSRILGGSTQTPRSQELLGHIIKEWLIKIMAAVFFLPQPSSFSQSLIFQPPNIIAHEKGFKCHSQPKTGAYSC